MRIKWLRQALLDLDEVESYIARDNPVAAIGVVTKIVKMVSVLEKQPGLGRPGRVPGSKELVIPDTPFIVPYRVKDGLVQVLRVYHTSRRWPDNI
ncbi:toxin, RelE family [Geotalea daltonii FRC-32]|uniref:Toxin, RelE family n=1 Tax=Geotalea daltonii (strain DSM 22248 / JCM 15807 / FRC-32) TaxID=316067 RepID=B9M549_GEODF|nr:type II toxin-antitoxin system RelE/ParE family toxin [Geotalea daltonii]ACM19804.1 toxin, RelE family [Geotalea daltonii FRC-32]